MNRDNPRSFTKEDLLHFQPRHATFVGIDSDGCVFDTMEVKQKNHFHPIIIRLWGLERIEKQLREAAEFFNLYSKWRGQNRFVALLLTFKALPNMPGVKDSDVLLPEYAQLESYIHSGLPLGTPSLTEEVKRTNDSDLKKLLDWNLEINRDIAANMESIPPFKWARRSLEKISEDSDVIVVSQTPEEALVKEWTMHDLASVADVIAGQELGTKSEHLKMATEGRYPPEDILMIGDAMGDLKTAEDNHALFYPINPGGEEESWQRFHDEVYRQFLEGKYGGDTQQKLIAEFKAALPEELPWR